MGAFLFAVALFASLTGKPSSVRQKDNLTNTTTAPLRFSVMTLPLLLRSLKKISTHCQFTRRTSGSEAPGGIGIHVHVRGHQPGVTSQPCQAGGNSSKVAFPSHGYKIPNPRFFG